jgi:hypothetical protein
MPIEPSAKIRMSEMGTFTTVPVMSCPQTVHPAPNGRTLKASSAVNIETTGAMM